MEYTGEEIQIVGISEAHVQAASNKTTSPRQCHELRDCRKSNAKQREI